MYSVVIYNKIKFKINLLNKDVIKVPCILLYFLYYYNFYQMKSTALLNKILTHSYLIVKQPIT